MKILLTAVNAKYVHTNLAVRYLKRHCQLAGFSVETAEYTINHHLDHLLSQLYREKPDLLAFSCYIWNIELIRELGPLLKQVLPNARILLGGPEVSFESESFLRENLWADFILRGEGEETLPELLTALHQGQDISTIPGITYRKDGDILSTPGRECMNMDELLFPYESEDLTKLQNRILYYEASRGCPFSCQYCLSSAEKGVRRRSLAHVYEDLEHFLQAKVRQVKFVDRTFNANRSYALSILKFLKKRDNGITNFHFELCADLLDEETLDFLQTVRPGLFQFEIGVQSTNPDTLSAIRRSGDLEILRQRVAHLITPGNCHVHLDLIAGLPHEDYDSFARSYNDVYAMKPHMLQLGFLKLLKGSGLYEHRDHYQIRHRTEPPYEVLQTNALSFDEILRLKDVEELNERYYNSMCFRSCLDYLVPFFPSPFSFFEKLAEYCRVESLFDASHSQDFWYQVLLNFFETVFPEKNPTHLKYLILHDRNLHEKLKVLPNWLEDVYDANVKAQLFSFLQQGEERQRLLPEYEGLDFRQVYRRVQALRFPFDPLGMGGKPDKDGKYTLLYNYRRPSLFGAAAVCYLPDSINTEPKTPDEKEGYDKHEL